MLAVFGFTVAGLLFIAFALTLPRIKGKQYSTLLQNFSYAYLLLAAAFITFGIASAINKPLLLTAAVIYGDLFIVAGTYLIVGILFQGSKRRNLAMTATMLGGIGLLVIRVLYFMPHPYIQDSILIFNSRRLVSFLLAAIFLLIWLPVNMRVSKLITTKIHQAQSLTRTSILLYTAATFSAAIFVLAKKPITLVISFTALSVAFLALVITNVALKSMEAKHHGR